METITSSNLAPYNGRKVLLSCTVGVVLCQVAGTLQVGYGLCQYGLELTNGVVIGFSFGRYIVQADGSLIVHIN